jgi:hypothetical protein
MLYCQLWLLCGAASTAFGAIITQKFLDGKPEDTTELLYMISNDKGTVDPYWRATNRTAAEAAMVPGNEVDGHSKRAFLYPDYINTYQSWLDSNDPTLECESTSYQQQRIQGISPQSYGVGVGFNEVFIPAYSGPGYYVQLYTDFVATSTSVTCSDWALNLLDYEGCFVAEQAAERPAYYCWQGYNCGC